MTLFDLLSKYFWLIALGMLAFQYARSANRGGSPTDDFDRRDEVDRYRRIWFGAQAVPWLIVGAGILSGSTKNIWDFFRPQHGNFFVLAFFGFAFAESLALIWWVFSGGAKKIVDLRLAEQFGHGSMALTERRVKVLACSGFIGVGALVVWCLYIGGLTEARTTFPRLGRPAAETVSADGYRVVFDVAQAGFTAWWVPAVGLLFVAAGAAVFYFRKDVPAQAPAFMRTVFPVLWLGFAVLFTVIASIGTYSNYRKVEDATEAGRVEVVEGPVTDFVPMPVTGHAMERFCVKHTCFEYSDFVVTPGFHNTASHGGPIRAGLPVRVTYVGPVIVKLEIAPAPR